LESTVADIRTGTPIVLRPGAVTAADLTLALRPAGATRPGTATAPAPAAAVGSQAAAADAAGSRRGEVDVGASPGTRYRHYAPECRVVITTAGAGAAVAGGLAAGGQAVGLVARGAAPRGVVELARPADVGALARELFAALRAAEARGLDVVVVDAVEEAGLGAAVMDRLRRAAVDKED